MRDFAKIQMYHTYMHIITIYLLIVSYNIQLDDMCHNYYGGMQATCDKTDTRRLTALRLLTNLPFDFQLNNN